MAAFPATGDTVYLTAAQFTARDYVLRDGQPGIESDTGKIKVGDGVTVWADLDYVLGTGTTPEPAEMTAEDAETGTDETAMLVSPKVLHDEVARQIAAIGT